MLPMVHGSHGVTSTRIVRADYTGTCMVWFRSSCPLQCILYCDYDIALRLHRCHLVLMLVLFGLHGFAFEASAIDNKFSVTIILQTQIRNGPGTY